MQEEAIHDLQSTLLDVFVGPVDGVSRLEAHDGSPTLVVERLPGLCGGQVVGAVLLIVRRLQESNWSGQEHIALGIEYADSRMGFFGSSVYLLGLALFIIREFLSKL
jgi:hypothetical protein